MKHPVFLYWKRQACYFQSSCSFNGKCTSLWRTGLIPLALEIARYGKAVKPSTSTIHLYPVPLPLPLPPAVIKIYIADTVDQLIV